MSKDKKAKKSHRETPPGITKRHSTKDASEESCRCKEMAKKAPKELLKVALEDLSFWKKTRKS